MYKKDQIQLGPGSTCSKEELLVWAALANGVYADVNMCQKLRIYEPWTENIIFEWLWRLKNCTYSMYFRSISIFLHSGRFVRFAATVDSGVLSIFIFSHDLFGCCSRLPFVIFHGGIHAKKSADAAVKLSHLFLGLVLTIEYTVYPIEAKQDQK